MTYEEIKEKFPILSELSDAAKASLDLIPPSQEKETLEEKIDQANKWFLRQLFLPWDNKITITEPGKQQEPPAFSEADIDAIKNISIYNSEAVACLTYHCHQYPSESEYLVEIFLGGKKVFEWWDDAQRDSPEDLIWVRMLKDIFEAGVLAGRL